MNVILGLIMLTCGLYLYNNEIRGKRIHKFNAVWRYRSDVFIYALLVGGTLFLLKALKMFIF
jgi:hypothetical protein